MRTLAIVNQKGGSGKTTTTVNLAAALGERDRRVLVIDLDPQASASMWFGVTDSGKGLLDVFTGDAALIDQVQETLVPGVWVVPCSTWLAGADKALAPENGAESIFRKRIAKLPKDRWDYCLIDCPPTLGVLTINALTAADEVVIPVESHVMALAGVAQIHKTVEVVKERLNPDLEITGVVACRVDARTRHSLEVVEKLRERFGKTVYKTVIRENIRLAECWSFAKPITQYDSFCYGAKDYRDLAAEVLKQERALAK
ncbi:MAG: ParA family protein [Planctomycetes bacterium]|nr:ParA family protein [Planctomycetota bacterium]